MTNVIVNAGDFFASDALAQISDAGLYTDEKLADMLEQLCEHFERHQSNFTDTASAATVAFFLLNRAFHLLGYTHSHNEPLPDEQGRAEFTLFDGADAFASHLAGRGTSMFFNGAVAVAKAVAWATSLDEPAAAEEGSDPEPIPFALDELMRITNIQWALLSNGKEWRLYHKNTAAMVNTYAGCNLLDIIQTRNFEAFKQFANVFGAKAISPDHTGTCPNRLMLS